MKAHIYPYKAGSASAKALADALGIKRAKREGNPLRTECFINWGSSVVHRDIILTGPMIYLNMNENVGWASNKLETFKRLEGRVATPPWTEDVVEASGWLAEDIPVCVRHKLNGHSGEGLVIHNPLDGELPEAPLYTYYMKKQQEYRIHVFQGKVIFQQRKARKKDIPDDQINWQIRNHGNGFIFAHEGVDVAPDGQQAAINAVNGLGLDFGAVDLIWHPNTGFTVLEVNTACGLEGKTLEVYVQTFKGVMENE